MRDRMWLWASMAVCAAVALLVIRCAPIANFNDSAIYMSLGEHLARGDGYHSSLHLFHDLIQPPLYPIAIALGSLVTTPLVSAIAITMLSWALTIPALVRIHRGLFGERGWRVVAASAAVYPMLSMSGFLGVEPLFVCLTTWAVAFGLEAIESARLKPSVLAGMFVGLSILTRPEGVLTMAVLGVLALASRRLKPLLAAAVVAMVLVAPYALFLRSQLGYFTIVPKVDYNRPLAEILRRMDWPPDQASMPRRDERAGYALMPDHKTFVLEYAFTHPEFDPLTQFPITHRDVSVSRLRDVAAAGRLAVWAGVRRYGFWNPLALLLMGLALWRRPRARGLAIAALVATFLVPALSSALNFEERFMMVPAVLSLILVGGGVAPLEDWLVGRVVWRSLIAPLVATLVVAAYALFLVRSIPHIDRDRERRFDERCVQVIPSGARILDHRARCAALTHGAFFALPYVDDMKTLTDYIANNGIDYAVFDEATNAKSPSAAIRNLHDPTSWPPAWKLVTALEWQDGTATRFVEVR